MKIQKNLEQQLSEIEEDINSILNESDFVYFFEQMEAFVKIKNSDVYKKELRRIKKYLNDFLGGEEKPKKLELTEPGNNPEEKKLHHFLSNILTTINNLLENYNTYKMKIYPTSIETLQQDLLELYEKQFDLKEEIAKNELHSDKKKFDDFINANSKIIKIRGKKTLFIPFTNKSKEK